METLNLVIPSLNTVNNLALEGLLTSLTTKLTENVFLLVQLLPWNHMDSVENVSSTAHRQHGPILSMLIASAPLLALMWPEEHKVMGTITQGNVCKYAPILTLVK
jgi:hypothetical protein